MSHEVQLNPAASHSPAATLPSSASAGHVTEAPETVTPYKSGFSGHFSQAPADYRPGPGPARRNRSSRSPRPHARLSARRPQSSSRPTRPRPSTGAPMPAHRERQRIALPAEPASQRSAGQARDPDRPVMYPGGTWHRPPADLPATGRRQTPATTPAHPILMAARDAPRNLLHLVAGPESCWTGQVAPRLHRRNSVVPGVRQARRPESHALRAHHADSLVAQIPAHRRAPRSSRRGPAQRRGADRGRRPRSPGHLRYSIFIRALSTHDYSHEPPIPPGTP
jgi:hypothetical protein